jgi:hypothetical protein
MQNNFLFLTFLLAILSACTPQSIGTPVPAKGMANATSIPLSTVISTPKMILPTRTPEPQPTAVITLTEECLNLEEQIPENLELSGVWVINEGNPYFENLADHMVYGVPLKGGGLLSTREGEMAISPDGTHMAYIDNYYDINDRLEKRVLRVIRSSGHSLDMSYWIQSWQWILGWTDDQNLAIASPKGKVVILNPITGNWREFQPPMAITSENLTYWNIPMYNPTLEWILSRQGYEGLTVQNVQTGQTVWQAKDVGWAVWSWSTTHPTLAVVSEKSIVIIKAGQQEEKFDTSKFGYEYLSDPKLSPDGQKLAFSSSKSYSRQPTILDINQHKLSRLCTNEFQTWDDPTWSPDNRFVIQAIYQQSNYKSFDLLIDTQQMRAYLLKSGYAQHRIAWLAQP